MGEKNLIVDDEESMPDLMRNGGLIRSRWCMKDRTYRQWKHEEFPLHWEV